MKDTEKTGLYYLVDLEWDVSGGVQTKSKLFTSKMWQLTPLNAWIYLKINRQSVVSYSDSTTVVLRRHAVHRIGQAEKLNFLMLHELHDCFGSAWIAEADLAHQWLCVADRILSLPPCLCRLLSHALSLSPYLSLALFLSLHKLPDPSCLLHYKSPVFILPH